MYIYGFHPVNAALKNPKRIVEKVFVTDAKHLTKLPDIGRRKTEIISKAKLEQMLPKEVVHQGVAAKVQSLPALSLQDTIYMHKDLSHQCLVVLDQVSDPHNVGAILRSCAVFGVQALIMTERHSPEQNGTLAKTASGALEEVNICHVTNLASALKELQSHGYWCVAFDERAPQTLHQVDLKGKIVLILGAEGEGLRRLTKEHCDFLVKLPTTETFSTLNVSNAAAIALYEVFNQQQLEK